MTRVFKDWFIGLVLTTAFVRLSFQWFDRPIALWVYRFFGEHPTPTDIAERIFSIPLMTAIVFVICGLVAIMGRRFSKFETAVVVCTISTLATIVIKDQLKFVFGRTWPDTWTPGITSFVHDNVYGFNFFHAGKAFGSFPSGHAAVAAAMLWAVWMLFPNLRIICAIGVVVVDIGLVAINQHFLGDVIAGSFLGVSTALLTITLWRASELEAQAVMPLPSAYSQAAGAVGKAAALD
jgi:membrane-associated phospholipid phosphatase